MTKHAEFMHEHRNITILSANAANVDNVSIEYPDPDTSNNHTATTLSNLLLSNSQIHRIYAHPASDKINISVIGTEKYPKVWEWLDHILAKFPYNPTRLAPTRYPSPSNKSSIFPNKTFSKGRTDKYTNKFAIPSDELSLTFDPCNISSQRRRGPKGPNAWANGPPSIEVYYDPNERMDFPPLQRPSIPTVSPANQGGYKGRHPLVPPLLGATTASTTVHNNNYDHVLGNNPPDKPLFLQPDIDTIIATLTTIMNHQSNEPTPSGSISQNPFTPPRKSTKIPKHDHTGSDTAYMGNPTSPTSPADSTMIAITIAIAEDGMVVDGAGED
jgi:hypothetical protein